jgi:hypothetical protein
MALALSGRRPLGTVGSGWLPSHGKTPWNWWGNGDAWRSPELLMQLLYVSHASTSTEPVRNRRDRQKGEGSLLHGHESR